MMRLMILGIVGTLVFGTVEARLPGVILHDHLEASTTAATLQAIAKGNGIDLPDSTFAFQETYQYTNLTDFLNAYYAVTAVLKTPADYYTLTKDYLKRCKDDGVLYTEFIVCPFCAQSAGIDWKEMIANVKLAMSEFEEPGIFYSRILITFVRGVDTPESAMSYVEWALAQRANGDMSIVGIHLSGDETAFPDVSPYIPVYQAAGDGGLGLAAHAGETTDAQNVIDAINKLNVSRIGHGIAAINSQEALNLLRKKNVTLEVCPTSNICTQAQNIKSYVTHPLGALVEAGVMVTLNPDDPIFFRETTQAQEMMHAANNFGYNFDQLRSFNANAIGASFVPDELKFKLFKILFSVEE